MENRLIVYTDGGARGNPGPAAIGIVFKQPQGKKEVKIDEWSKSIGEATNNEAEYQAIIFALKKIKAKFGKEKAKNFNVEIRLDSELVARQLNDQYKIEEENLVPLFIDVWNLKKDFKSVKFVEIPREKNKEADRLLNQELNKQGMF